MFELILLLVWAILLSSGGLDTLAIEISVGDKYCVFL
jgi:hypothetical protein